MRTLFRLFFVAAVGAFATGAVADTSSACKDCDPQGQDSSKSHREQIKADRAKYDRENEKIIARPWDGIRDNKPLPEKNK
jgi:hypothetical protein